MELNRPSILLLVVHGSFERFCIGNASLSVKTNQNSWIDILWKPAGFPTDPQQQHSPMIPLSLLSRVEVGLWEGGPGLLLVMGPGAGEGAGLGIELERVPLGLQCGEGKDKGWSKDWPPALVFRVEEGLSEQGEAVLQVRVELGLPPRAEVSHWKRRAERWWYTTKEVKVAWC